MSLVTAPWLAPLDPSLDPGHALVDSIAAPWLQEPQEPNIFLGHCWNRPDHEVRPGSILCVDSAGEAPVCQDWVRKVFTDVSERMHLHVTATIDSFLEPVDRLEVITNQALPNNLDELGARYHFSSCPNDLWQVVERASREHRKKKRFPVRDSDGPFRIYSDASWWLFQLDIAIERVELTSEFENGHYLLWHKYCVFHLRIFNQVFAITNEHAGNPDFYASVADAVDKITWGAPGRPTPVECFKLIHFNEWTGDSSYDCLVALELTKNELHEELTGMIPTQCVGVPETPPHRPVHPLRQSPCKESSMVQTETASPPPSTQETTFSTCLCRKGCRYPQEDNTPWCLYCNPAISGPRACCCFCEGCDPDSDASDAADSDVVAPAETLQEERYTFCSSVQLLDMSVARVEARLNKRRRLGDGLTSSEIESPNALIIQKNRLEALERRRDRTGSSLCLSVIHAHGRDRRIHFDEPSHIYTLDRHHKFPISVSGVWGKFFGEFDPLATAWKYIHKWSLDVSSKYYDFIAEMSRNGHDTEGIVNGIVDSWSEKGRLASSQGTYVHRQIELFLNGEESDESLPAMDQFKRFMKEVVVPRGWEPHRTEGSIIDEEFMVAGQIDCVFKHRSKPEYYMVDWKNSNKILDPDYNKRWGRYGMGPCSKLVDNAWSHYCAQQNLYSYMLRTEYGLDLKSMHLLQVHETQETYKLIPIPSLPNMAAEMLEIATRPFPSAPQHPIVMNPSPTMALHLSTSMKYFALHNAMSMHAAYVSKRSVPSVLLGSNNCLPCNLANVLSDWKRLAKITLRVGRSGRFNDPMRYCDGEALFGVTFNGRKGIDFNRTGKFILHFTFGGASVTAP